MANVQKYIDTQIEALYVIAEHVIPKLKALKGCYNSLHSSDSRLSVHPKGAECG